MKRLTVALAAALVAMTLSFSSPGAAEDLRDESVPVDIVLLIDNSATMRGFKMEPVYAFLDAVESCCRVAVVGFGEEAAVLQELTHVRTVHEKKSVKEALSIFKFVNDYADIYAGLSEAQAELSEGSSERSPKMVLILSDGRVNEPASSGDRDGILTGLLDGVLADYFLDGITVHAVAVGNADLEFLQNVTHAAAGWCLRAPNEVAFDDGLAAYAAIAESMQPLEVGSGESSGAIVERVEVSEPAAAAPAVLWVALALILVVGGAAVGLLFVVLGRMKTAAGAPEPQRPGDEKAPSIAQMRYRVDRVAKLLKDAGMDLESFQVDLVSYGAERWEKERNFLDRYHNLTEHVFLLLDHLEVQVKETASAESSRLLYRKANRILEEEGIEEIPVKKGDSFDGKFHKHVGERPGDEPQGTILEVARKGYLIRHELEGEEEFVLRPAEVVVSSGPADPDVN